MHSVSTQTTHDANARTGSPTEIHSFTVRKPTHEEKHEDTVRAKTRLRCTRKAQGRELRGQEKSGVQHRTHRGDRARARDESGRTRLERWRDTPRITRQTGWEKLHAQTVAWSNGMEGHAQKCFEQHCELANKKVEQCCKDSIPCLDDHQFKQEELEACYLARIGRLDILWSVSKLARAVTKWTQTCDGRLAIIVFKHSSLK